MATCTVSVLKAGHPCVLCFMRMYVHVHVYIRVYFRKSDKGGELHIQEILGGNMKTHVAV